VLLKGSIVDGRHLVIFLAILFALIVDSYFGVSHLLG